MASSDELWQGAFETLLLGPVRLLRACASLARPRVVRVHHLKQRRARRSAGSISPTSRARRSRRSRSACRASWVPGCGSTSRVGANRHGPRAGARSRVWRGRRDHARRVAGANRGGDCAGALRPRRRARLPTLSPAVSYAGPPEACRNSSDRRHRGMMTASVERTMLRTSWSEMPSSSATSDVVIITVLENQWPM